MIELIKKLEQLCGEIDGFSESSGGGTMSCPSQVVATDTEYIKENILEKENSQDKFKNLPKPTILNE